MSRNDAPIGREVLLVGGGHAHVAVVRRFGERPVPGVRVTLLSRDAHTPYSGMLPGLVAGHYSRADCHIDLARLCAASGVRLVQGTLLSVDLSRQRVEITERHGLAWDLLSLNTGSAPALETIAGALDHGLPVKPVDRFLRGWVETETAILHGGGPQSIIVVGGGAAAVEIALAIAWRLSQRGIRVPRVRMAVVCAGHRLLEGHNGRVRAAMERDLARMGIEVLTGARVSRAFSDHLALTDGRLIPCDLPVWAVHAGAPAWPRDAGLVCDDQGFVRVDACLRAVSHPTVFAAGDIAALPERVPKSGVYAVREGQVLGDNLIASLRGLSLRRYHPQRHFLSLLSTGGRYAVASRGPFYARGEWVWHWKDRIDRRFMSMYRPVPLSPEALSGTDAMRCGGCAAKIDAATLADVVGSMAANENGTGTVLHGVASAEDGAVIAPPPGQMLVQSVDYFRAFVDDPWLLGRIGAVHALGDLHAMGATPHSALAIATVPHAGSSVVRETLAQLMAGARSVLAQEAVTLVGGHSSEGVELGFGLSVNGFVPRENLLLKSGLRHDQALILTKALGSGVLFAANMAGAADGEWIRHALDTMQQGHAAAMRILRRHQVSACTDVTGFGLIGHLGEMLDASGMGALLFPDALPALAGARELLAAGYRSSLHAANAEALGRVEGVAAVDTATQALLVDPQTAGGLLAAVPWRTAQACLAELRAAGYVPSIAARIDASCSAGRITVSQVPTL